MRKILSNLRIKKEHGLCPARQNLANFRKEEEKMCKEIKKKLKMKMETAEQE